ncbi:aminotransferase class IV [Myxococcota bacterium]|nr:aminotransferase class IV [Myxococcota bacterium]MBU1429094.1 aminotransferase class IV [Myxococcota bacterium]MBU1899960.1 aminotransferase class IV [Myxococcota bacterium]
MKSWVNIDGVITPGEAARVSVFDRGFLFGDAVYEVLRTVDQAPLFWEAHRARLWRSARALCIPLDALDPSHLYAQMQATLAQADWGESSIRVIITRGEGEPAWGAGGFGQARWIIIVEPLRRPDPALYAQGCVLKTFGVARGDRGGLDPRIKSSNKLVAVMAIADAQAAGAHEALRVDPLGRILEGATSTFFLVRGGVLLTPPIAVGILEGITRAKVIELAQRLGVPFEEVELHIDDLPSADEAFICSSIRGVLPVRQIDQYVFSAPGPICRVILEGYERSLRGALSPSLG